MSLATKKPPPPDDRRQRDRERALQTLERMQEAGMFGVVSFHMQAGRIVRAKVETTEEFKEG